MYTANLKSILAIIVLTLALMACQSETPSTEEDGLYGDLDSLSPNGALVVFWHPLAGGDEEYLLAMIDDFNASNPWDITVVGEYQGSLQTLHDKVLAGISTDQLPTLVIAEPGTVATYVARDIALALTPYVESEDWGFTEEELQDFFPSTLATEELPQFQNELFSFPCCRSLQVLYYNLDWLKELGYDAPPQTWAEFREIACAGSNPAEDVFGFEMGMDSSIFTSLLMTQDIPLLDARATAYTLGGEQGLAALRFLQALFNDGCALWETDGSQIADFSAGRVLFVIDSTARLSTYRQSITADANFSLALSSLPHTTDDPVVNVQGFSTAILRSSPKEQLAAWLFVKWLSEPAQQARWSGHKACFPTRRSAFEQMGAFLEEHPYYASASQFLEQEWVTDPRVTAYEACRAEMARMLYAVTAGESVAEWLNDTQTHCNQTLGDAID